MKQLLQAIERNPLGVSVLALAASLPSLGAVFALGGEGFSFDDFDWRTLALAGCSLCLSASAVANLVRAEMRGYSSMRTGLSVTALFFAFVPEIGLMLKLLRHI